MHARSVRTLYAHSAFQPTLSFFFTFLFCMEIYDGSKFSMRKMPDRPCRGIFFLLLEIHFSFSESPPKATDRKDIHFRERDILFSWAIIWFYYLGSMNASDLNLQVLWVTTRCTLVKAVSQFSSNSLSVCMNIYTGIPFLWKVKTFRSGLKLKRLGGPVHPSSWVSDFHHNSRRV